ALATSRALDSGDLPGFDERARRILATEPGWAAVMLSTPAGTPLVDTRLGYGQPLPPLAERDSFERAVRTRQPTIGDLAEGPDRALIFPVRVPVERDGVLRYVLSAVIAPDEIKGVLTRQRVPADWLISIFDARGRRVARSRAHETNLGGRAAESLQELMAG